jgi:hypothetical protein
MKAKVFSENLVFIYQDIWRHITGYRIIYYGKHNSSQQDPTLSQINPVNAISSLRSSLQPEELNLCQHCCEKNKKTVVRTVPTYHHFHAFFLTRDSRGKYIHVFVPLFRRVRKIAKSDY